MSPPVASPQAALAYVEAGLMPAFHLARILKQRLDRNHDDAIWQSERDLGVILPGAEFEDIWTLATEIEAKLAALRLELARRRRRG